MLPTFFADIYGGAEGDRTPDLYNAIVALSQLSYGPIFFFLGTSIALSEQRGLPCLNKSQNAGCRQKETSPRQMRSCFP